MDRCSDPFPGSRPRHAQRGPGAAPGTLRHLRVPHLPLLHFCHGRRNIFKLLKFIGMQTHPEQGCGIWEPSARSRNTGKGRRIVPCAAGAAQQMEGSPYKPCTAIPASLHLGTHPSIQGISLCLPSAPFPLCPCSNLFPAFPVPPASPEPRECGQARPWIPDQFFLLSCQGVSIALLPWIHMEIFTSRSKIPRWLLSCYQIREQGRAGVTGNHPTLVVFLLFLGWDFIPTELFSLNPAQPRTCDIPCSWKLFLERAATK